jgi:hypothetical protein
MKHAKLWLGLLVLALLVGGLGVQCAATAAPRQSYGTAPAPAMTPAPEGQRAGEAGADSAKSAVSPVTGPMIIKTAELSLVVPDTKKSLDDVTRIATATQGHVSSSTTQKSGDRLLATVVIRVPAASFETVLAQLRALGDIQRDSVRGQDVTAEYVDLTSRLTNLEAKERELLVLMTEAREKSGKMEEVLAVYRELTATRGEIESIKGQMKLLEDQAAMSTITVSLSPQVPETQVVPTGWYPDQTLREAVSTLVAVLQGLINLGIWCVVFSVFLIPFVLVAGVALLVVYIRRRAKGRATRVA